MNPEDSAKNREALRTAALGVINEAFRNKGQGLKESEKMEAFRAEITAVVNHRFSEIGKQLAAQKATLLKEIEEVLHMPQEELERRALKTMKVTDVRTLLLSTKTTGQQDAKPIWASDATSAILEGVKEREIERNKDQDDKERWKRVAGERHTREKGRREYCFLAIFLEAMQSGNPVVQKEELMERTGYVPSGIRMGIKELEHLLRHEPQYALEGNGKTGWRLVAKDPSEET